MNNTREFYRLGTKLIKENVVVAGVYNEKTRKVSVHFSRCAKYDKYNKDLGKKMAIGRAVKNPLATLKVEDGKNAGRLFKAWADAFLVERRFEGVTTRNK